MSLAEFAAQNGLQRVGARAPLWSYLKQTWERRDFIFQLAWFRLRSSVEANRLGVGWLVLQPAINALVYGTIFGLLQQGARGPDYPAHVVIGVFLFQFFSRSLSDGAKSITGNRSLVQSLAFPRMTMPLAEVFEQFLSILPSMALLVVVLPILGHWPSWHWLLVIPLLGLFLLFNAGVAMIAARLTVHVRDLTQLLPFISRLLFYTSGVLFDVNRLFVAHPWVVKLYDFHPLYQVLQMARAQFMGGHDFSSFYWFSFSAWAVLIFVVGVVFFWSAEERYGRE